MEEAQDPYAPPKSSVEQLVPVEGGPYFFTTSTFKLVVMSTVTLGLYELYWFYKNWVMIRDRSGQKLIPILRAFFSPIWAYSMFKKIREVARDHELEATLPAGLLAIGYILFQIVSQVPDPYWLIGFFAVAVLILPNKVALAVNRKRMPDFENNERFTAWNAFGIVLGGLILGLNIYALFVPEFLAE